MNIKIKKKRKGVLEIGWGDPMILHYQTAVIRFQCVHSWGEIPRVATYTG